MTPDDRTWLLLSGWRKVSGEEYHYSVNKKTHKLKWVSTSPGVYYWALMLDGGPHSYMDKFNRLFISKAIHAFNT